MKVQAERGGSCVPQEPFKSLWTFWSLPFLNLLPQLSSIGRQDHRLAIVVMDEVTGMALYQIDMFFQSRTEVSIQLPEQGR